MMNAHYWYLHVYMTINATWRRRVRGREGNSGGSRSRREWDTEGDGNGGALGRERDRVTQHNASGVYTKYI